MALPEYFKRNAQAAAALIQGLDATLLAARLEQEVIGVAYDVSAHASKEGQAALDMTLRLFSRVYPTLVIAGLPGTKPDYQRALENLARSINPRVTVLNDIAQATKLLVFGGTMVRGNRKAKAHTWYVGSDNWFAKLSKAAPVGSGKSANPLAAGAAACVAVANIFRAVFVSKLGAEALDSEVAVSLLDLRPVGPGSANPAVGRVKFEDVHLVGAGAIGNGVLWALSRMACEGTLHVVDHESVSDSNLQRYVMASAADRTRQKAALAQEWLKKLGPHLEVIPHPTRWDTHVAGIAEHKVDTVISAVDSAQGRIEIQSSLPRLIFNGWTQRGEAGVSRHTFLGESACLACLYLPTGKAPSEDVVIAIALRLGGDDVTVREVRRRLYHSIPTERTFLERIATAAGLDYMKLAAFENRPLRELYVQGVCGGGVMEFRDAALQAKAEVPMGFQSALAGILLAAELARPSRLAETVAQIDLLSTFPERPGHLRAKTLTPLCICSDNDFIEVFKQKYLRGA